VDPRLAAELPARLDRLSARPFLSPEDETVLEAGMTFTDEPSLLLDGRFGVRIEDVVVCAEGGARPLNRLGPGPIPAL